MTVCSTFPQLSANFGRTSDNSVPPQNEAPGTSFLRSSFNESWRVLFLDEIRFWLDAKWVACVPCVWKNYVGMRIFRNTENAGADEGLDCGLFSINPSKERKMLNNFQCASLTLSVYRWHWRLQKRRVIAVLCPFLLFNGTFVWYEKKCPHKRINLTTDGGGRLC